MHRRRKHYAGRGSAEPKQSTLVAQCGVTDGQSDRCIKRVEMRGALGRSLVGRHISDSHVGTCMCDILVMASSNNRDCAHVCESNRERHIA